MSILGFSGDKDVKKIFSYFLAICLFVLALIVPILYIRSAKVLEKETIKYTENMLIQINRSMDVVLDEVNNSLTQLVIDYSIGNYMEYYNYGENLILHKINEYFTNYYAINKYIHSVSIYYYKEDKVFSPRQGVIDADDFNDVELIMNVRNGKEDFNSAKSRKVYDEISGKFEDVITIVKPIPLLYYKPKAAIALNIKEGYLTDIINTINIRDDLQIMLIDEDKKILSYKGNNDQNEYVVNYDNHINDVFTQPQGSYITEINGKKMLVSYITSNINGWRYVGLIPYKSIIKSIEFLLGFFIMLTCTVLLLSIFISLYFTNRLYKPIEAIAGLFFRADSKKEKSESIYKYIRENVSNIMQKNRSLEDTARQYHPVLKNNFINNMLKGNLYDKLEINEKIEFYELSIGKYKNYIVYVISIDNYEEFFRRYTQKQKNMLTVYLTELSNFLIGEKYNGIACESGMNEIAVIVNLPQLQTEKDMLEIYKNIAIKLHETLTENMKHTVTIGIGRYVEDITDIADSYYEAMHALQYSYITGHNRIICFDDIKSRDDKNYQYPYKVETQLLNALKQGKMDIVSEKFKDMASILSSQKGDNISYILIQFLCSLIKSIHEIGGDIKEISGKKNIFEEMLKLKNLDEIENWYSEIFRSIIVYFDERKNSKNKDIVESVMDFINQNFADQLSLDVISEQVFLSPSHLSRIFKQESGKNLKEYINEVRIENAKMYLMNSDKTISQIGEKVGYDKVQSFIKIFKEYVGTTPGRYRETTKK